MIKIRENTSQPISIKDNFISSIFDNSSQMIAFLVHLFYFLVIIFIKSFRARSYIYLHHVNTVSLLYVIHYIAYFDTRSKSIKANISPALCNLSELSWSTLKYMRMYSLTLLAFYRYLAVNGIEFYKKLNKNLFNLYSILMIMWLVSISLSLILKYSLDTEPAYFYCRDGYTKNKTFSLIYYCISISLNNILPNLMTIFIYVKMNTKLERTRQSVLFRFSKVNRKVRPNNQLSDNMISDFTLKNENIFQASTHHELSIVLNQRPSIDIRPNYNPAHLKFKKQLIVINLCIFLNSLALIYLDLLIVLLDNANNRTFIQFVSISRPLIRSIFFIVQLMIPLASIYYNPLLMSDLNVNFAYLKNRFLCPKSSRSKLEMYMEPKKSEQYLKY